MFSQSLWRINIFWGWLMSEVDLCPKCAHLTQKQPLTNRDKTKQPDSIAH
jgi:hypothetical protein